MSSSLFSICFDGCKFPFTSCFLYFCDSSQILVCFPGWSKISFGLGSSSLIIGYELLPPVSCMERDESLRFLCLISKIVP